MNERFTIRLIKNGAPLPVAIASDRTGLVLQGETDAFPRKFFLEFDSRSSVTDYRMRNVQRINGWRPWEFRLKISVTNDGGLQFRGYNKRSLPPGHYWLKPKIEDLKLGKGKRIKLKIKKDKETLVEIRAKEDSRRVELTKQIPRWDAEMNRVVTASDSKLDDKTVADWLDSSEPRESRKACLLNILAALRGKKGLQKSLLHPIQDLFFAGVDRIYTRTSADLYRVVDDLAKDPKKRFYYEGRPTSSIHRKILDTAAEKFGVNPRDFVLRSYRSEGGPSLQIVFGIPKGVAATHFAEMDIDLGNPLQDVTGFVVHLGELLDAGRTDHFALRKKLAKSKAKPFLYYRVRKRRSA
jgi:hypothetical protein